MSAACRTNPLQQFITKSERNQRSSGSYLGPHESQFSHGNGVSSLGHLERHFLDHREAPNGFLSLQHPAPMVAPMGNMKQEQGREDWLQQFSSVRIEDPMEFCQEYKDLYTTYESRQSMPAPRAQALHGGVDHMNIARQNANSHVNRVAQREVDDISSSRLDEEFENLEAELQKSEPLGSNEMYDSACGLDNEQMEFQKIANNIVDSCASISNSPSPVSSKLSGSKFMGLMRGISEGSITLKKGNERTTEFHSPENGETVGNEYFPVLDITHQNATH